MNRLLALGVVLSSGLAFAAQRESAGGGCCSLIVVGLFVYLYRSGGADWLRAIGAAMFPGIVGWFIWRDRGLGSGSRWVALIMAVLHVFFVLLGIVLAVVLTGTISGARSTPKSPVEKTAIYREGFVRRCQATDAKEVCVCIADQAAERDERDRKQLSFNLQRGALESWLLTTRKACRTENPVAAAPVKEDDSLGLHPRSSITSDPTGATVFVNGEERGTTPLDTPLTAGQRNDVKVVLDGYFPESTDRQPNAKEHFDLRFTLKAAALLEVTTTPPGAKVLVGLKPVLARTPGTSEALEPGESYVIVSRDGYQSHTRTMTLPAGKTPLEVTLTPGVKVAVTCSPVEGEVFVDGVLLGETPLDVFVSPKGKHTIEVKKETWSSAKRVFASVTKPTVFDAKLTDVGIVAARKVLAAARAKYDKTNDVLEKHQQKMERSAGLTYTKLEKQLPPLERAMEQAAAALEKAEAEVKRLEEERGLQPAPPKKDDDE